MNVRRISFLLLLLGLICACSEDKKTPKTSSTESTENASNTQLSLPALYEHFENSGIKIERKDPKIGSLIGATAGKSLRIGDGAVEVYQYNLSIESGVEALERLKKRGVMGSAAIVKGNLALLDKPDHPQWAAIKAAFLSMK